MIGPKNVINTIDILTIINHNWHTKLIPTIDTITVDTIIMTIQWNSK